MALDALWGFFSFMGRVRKEFSEVAGCSVLERATGRSQNAPCSVTMVDCLVLKLMHPKTAHELGRCISKYRKICLVFLFQRAVSAIFSWKALSTGVYSRPDGSMGAL